MTAEMIVGTEKKAQTEEKKTRKVHTLGEDAVGCTRSSIAAVRDGRGAGPVGRMVGGSTTINYMFNIRGNRRDFDNWEAMGNKGWSYKDVVPYFKKVEDLRIPELQNRENRGYGGRIRTTYPPYFS
ncbi:Glucose dehydrogenase [FAD, quinone], partial [Gryllus bimaculatus]